MIKKTDIFDILFWIAMIILIGYIIGKIIGLINTPEWMDLIPLITLVFIIGIFYQKVISFMEIMYKRTDYLKSNTDKIIEKLDNHEKRISSLEKD